MTLTPPCLTVSPENANMEDIFVQSLYNYQIMNTDICWGKWGLESLIWVILWPDGSSMSIWSIFSTLTTPVKVHHCSLFSLFVDNEAHCVLLESQSSRSGSNNGLACKIKLFLRHWAKRTEKHSWMPIHSYYSTEKIQKDPVLLYL